MKSIKEKYQKLAAGVVIILICGVLAGALYAVAGAKDHGISMSHPGKANTMKLDCSLCHAPIAGNTRNMAFPNHDNCAVCHSEKIDSSSKTVDCAFCHTNADYSTSFRKTVLSPLVTFDHERHGKAGVTCTECHNPATEPASGKLIPDMDSCIRCHSAKGVSKAEDCTACHAANFDKIKPANHTALWSRNHGKQLDQNTIKGYCDKCHTLASNNDCNSCHRIEKPANHTLSFAKKGHVKYAQTDRESCAVCHTQSQCITCHASTPPMSHTPFWGGSHSRHCLRCHMGGDDFVSSVDNMESNCGTCHQQGMVYAKHTALPRSGTHSGGASLVCNACHDIASGVRIPHPFLPIPDNNASCVTCHP